RCHLHRRGRGRGGPRRRRGRRPRRRGRAVRAPGTPGAAGAPPPGGLPPPPPGAGHAAPVDARLRRARRAGGLAVDRRRHRVRCPARHLRRAAGAPGPPGARASPEGPVPDAHPAAPAGGGRHLRPRRPVTPSDEAAGSPADRLRHQVAAIEAHLEGANTARERALAATRRVIRAAGSSIRAVHRLDPGAAAALAAESEAALRDAQRELEPYPAVAHAGFLHDAEKEYVEARAVMALVAGDPVPGPEALAVSPTAWMRGVA